MLSFFLSSGQSTQTQYSEVGASWGIYGNWDNTYLAQQIAMDDSDHVYVLFAGGSNSKRTVVQKFNNTGSFITTFDTTAGLFDQINTFTFEKDTLYFSTASSHILKVRSSGKLIKRWGSKGFKDGQLSNPQGLGIDTAGNVFVCDVGNSRIQKYNKNGNFLLNWQFDYPYYISVDQEGYVYLIGSLYPQQHSGVYNNLGKFVSTNFDSPGFYIDNNQNRWFTEPFYDYPDNGWVDRPYFIDSLGNKTVLQGIGWPQSNYRINTNLIAAFDSKGSIFAIENGKVIKHVLLPLALKDEEIKNPTISLYPNPNIGTFEISSTDKINKVSVINILGDRQESKSSTIHTNFKGILTVEIQTQKNTFYKRVIVE